MNQDAAEKRLAEYVTNNRDAHYRLAFSYVKNQDDALDVVQESIYKAFAACHSLKDPSSIKTWYYRILVNTALDFLRKRRREILADEDFLSALDKGKIDDYRDFDLKIALDNLAYNYRSIIILRYFEDLKIQEIADVLNENINTVKTRLYAGLKKLRISMNDEEKQEVLI